MLGSHSLSTNISKSLTIQVNSRKLFIMFTITMKLHSILIWEHIQCVYYRFVILIRKLQCTEFYQWHIFKFYYYMTYCFINSFKLLMTSDHVNDYIFSFYGHRGRDRMVVGFTTTCAISTYHYKSCELESRLWRCVLNITLCDKVCQWLVAGQWLSLGTPVSSINTTDCHDITEIMLKVGVKHKVT